MSLHAKLLEHMHYDPKTGVGTWKTGNRARKVGGRVGGVVQGTRSRPYRRLRLDFLGLLGKSKQFSHVAHFYMTGKWPPEEMDHGAGGTLDDSWSNLRPCTRDQNEAHRGVRKNNRLGIKGIWLDTRYSPPRYCAAFHRRGRHVRLGTFSTPEAAHAAYINGVKEYDGEFLRAA